MLGIFLASNVVRVGGGIAALPLVGKDRDESCQILAAAFQATSNICPATKSKEDPAVHER